MQTLFLFVVLFCSITVWAQTELISDPGFLSIAQNQCEQDSIWNFRSDFLWNQTTDFVDAQCQVFLELPTNPVSGVTKGNETNINRFRIPALPTVEGTIDPAFPASAAVVDFNTPCRAAIWAPFTLDKNSATVTIDFLLWTTSLSETAVQQFIDDSSAQNATELQYLKEPFGLLSEDLDVFPPVEEVVNLIRVDILKPDLAGSFYDRAFSTDPAHIAASFSIPFFEDDNAIPVEGTAQWAPVSFAVEIPDAGKYALRFAGAHSVIGAAWGISDVHLTSTGGNDNNTVTPLEYDMLIDNAAQTVGGTLTVSKIPPPPPAPARKKNF